MCASPNCTHADLDDNLSDIFGEIEVSPRTARIEDLAVTQQVRGLHVERCKACRGTGKFISYTGRVVGDCFKCKGKGERSFRSSIEQREKARTQAAARKERTLAQQQEAFAAEQPEIAAWIAAKSAKFDFARALGEAVAKYGHLTERQLASAEKCRLRDAEREAQWAAERAAREATAAVIDISRIALALATATGNGLKWPKLRLAEFTFSLAGANSRNAGAIYVKADETYLGKIADGRFTRSRDCTSELEAAIIAAAADPEAAATAYGHQTGVCACCGRELTNPESVERGIGPVCASKWGW